MDFNSLNFIFLFLPLFISIFLVIRPNYRKIFLIITSVLFYYIYQKNTLLLSIGLISANYFILVGLGKLNQTARKYLFYVAVSTNLLVLIFFKLFTNPVWINTSLFKSLLPTSFYQQLTFPLGLSFITFQVLSCLIDTYRKPETTPRKFQDYFLYILFFPKVVVGPIVKFSKFDTQVYSINFSWARVADGSKRFIRGFAKKVIIADNLALVVNAGFGLDKPAYPGSIAWLVIIAYFLQIYYDFSGYIDMGLGIAYIVGIELPENFNSPYSSKNLTEFWRRWHMSLTAWFREYVFYPLEYKRRRVKFFRTETHTILVFLLTGLWHGITVNYIVWGLAQGLIIIFENSRVGRWIKRLPRMIQHGYLIGIVMGSWVIFRSPSIEFALRFFERLVITGQSVGLYPFSLSQPLPIINNSTLLIMIIGIIGLLPISNFYNQPAVMKIKSSPLVNLTSGIGYVIILIVSIAFVASQNFIPSIYGQF